MAARSSALSPKRTAMIFAFMIVAGPVLGAIASGILFMPLAWVIGLLNLEILYPFLFAAVLGACLFGGGWLAGSTLKRRGRERIGFGLGTLFGLPLLVPVIISLQGFSPGAAQDVTVSDVGLLLGIWAGCGTAAFAIIGSLGGAFLGEGWRLAARCGLRFAAAGAVGAAVAGTMVVAGVLVSQASEVLASIAMHLGAVTLLVLPAGIAGWLLVRELNR